MRMKFIESSTMIKEDNAESNQDKQVLRDRALGCLLGALVGDSVGTMCRSMK